MVAASHGIRNTDSVSDKPIRRDAEKQAITRVADLDAEALPVVARLVIEIRSDGSRTIARGGLEDMASGQRVTVEARGDSPLQLAVALAKSLSTLPAFRRTQRVAMEGTTASDSNGDAMTKSQPRAGLRSIFGARKLVRDLLGRKQDR